MVKLADEMLEDEDSEVKNFFEHVIGKTEEILSQNSLARSERHISEVFNPYRSLRENGKITMAVGEHSYRRSKLMQNS